MENEILSFDVSKVEEKLKNVKCLSDITGPNGVIEEIITRGLRRSSHETPAFSYRRG